jgi:hypothetical protein
MESFRELIQYCGFTDLGYSAYLSPGITGGRPRTLLRPGWIVH